MLQCHGLALLHLGRIAAFPGKDQDLDLARSHLEKASLLIEKSEHRYYIVMAKLEWAHFLLKNAPAQARSFLQEATDLGTSLYVYPSLLIDAQLLQYRMDPLSVNLKEVGKQAVAVGYGRALKLIDRL